MGVLFKETVEEIKADEASVSKPFGGDGSRVRDRRKTPKYMELLVQASEFVEEVVDGKRPMYHLSEAMSMSDFPILFADILDRQLLGSYREIAPVWQNYIQAGTVPDFRNVQRTAIDGAEGPLPEVDELEEYPEAQLEEAKDQYKVRKYGRRLDLSWETLVNDDLDAFRNAPQRLAKGARRTEQRLATQLYVDENGPRADLYTVGNGNIIPGNPELSLEGLQIALDHLATFSDNDDEPIDLDLVHLVTGPGLAVRASNIMNATEVEIETGDGLMRTNSWVSGRLKHHVDPYIPRIATGLPDGDQPWFLMADPGDGRAFAELGFLRGHEDPALYERVPNARRIGGGEVMESFEDDSQAWRVRHVVGGGLLLETGGAKATAASDGSGS